MLFPGLHRHHNIRLNLLANRHRSQPSLQSIPDYKFVDPFFAAPPPIRQLATIKA
jgi:hypothetical protein